MIGFFPVLVNLFFSPEFSLFPQIQWRRKRNLYSGGFIELLIQIYDISIEIVRFCRYNRDTTQRRSVSVPTASAAEKEERLMSDLIRVTMLGKFTIRQENRQVDDRTNRMRKVWLLLAYLIYTRNTPSSQEQFLDLFRSGSEDSEDPAGRLKSLFYRARMLLDELGNGAGHELVIHRGGSYRWNTQIPLRLDTEEFDRLCAQGKAAQAEGERLACYLEALKLYQGDFLSKLSSEEWVRPISSYYHQLFLEVTEETLALLAARQRWAEAQSLCLRAIGIEPYQESLYQHLIRCRLALGDQAGAVAAYETLYRTLFDGLGLLPSEESRRLYREAAREPQGNVIPMGTLEEQLQEPAGPRHAMLCEYDFFRLLYQVQARSIGRTGLVIHIALLSLGGQRKKPLSRRSLNLAAENLTTVAAQGLRQGDVISRCSESQLILMLPQANYENSCLVCQRIIKAFFRQYPHSPADIQFSVRPLAPTPLPS
jgi:DNA-binding SARP family transcriptional activator